jgi:hypothetical protein
LARDDAAQRARIRNAILDYVNRYPHAADTAGGILERWLPRDGFDDAPDHIAAVLDEMVANRRLEVRQLPGGEGLYVRCDAPDK